MLGPNVGGQRQPKAVATGPTCWAAMLDYCAKHNIVSDIEMTTIDKIDEAYERILKGDVRYRFVIDMKSF